MDGNTEYTDIKTVQRNSENQNIQLIPNPAKEKVAIAFDFPTTGAYQIKIIDALDRKSTRLNSSHVRISYAVFCLKKKNNHLALLLNVILFLLVEFSRHSMRDCA